MYPAGASGTRACLFSHLQHNDCHRPPAILGSYLAACRLQFFQASATASQRRLLQSSIFTSFLLSDHPTIINILHYPISSRSSVPSAALLSRQDGLESSISLVLYIHTLHSDRNISTLLSEPGLPLHNEDTRAPLCSLAYRWRHRSGCRPS